MDIFLNYEKLAVKVHCINSNGSGCLYQPFTKDFSYVITAKHCLEGTEEDPQSFNKNDIKIYLKGNSTSTNVLDFYLHDQYDLAVIKVEYIEDIPSTLISRPKENQELGVYGFPDILNLPETEWLGQRLKCSLNFYYRNEKLIEFIPDTDIMNIYNTTKKTVVGLSGSGIYYEKNNNLYLIGIFTELKEEEGAYKGLLGYDISLINEVLSKNALPLLMPEELLNFERYIATAFDSNEGIIKPALKKNARALSDLQPNHIVEYYKGKLYLPYNLFIEEELLNPILWEGWVALLTYYYMDTTSLPVKDDFKLTRSKVGSNHNLRMYFTGYTTLSKCIMEVFVNNYEDLEKNDVIVINTKGRNPGRKSFNKGKTQKVLRKIDSAERDKLIENGIEIDNPDHLKGVEFIHIDLFLDKFSEFDEVENLSDLEEMLTDSIKEVFNNVP